MINNFVFDLGNVVVSWNPDYIIEQFTNDEVIKQVIKKELFMSDYWEMFDYGTISQDDLKKKVNLNVDSKDHITVNKIIDGWYNHLPVNLEIERLIKELKQKGYKIYLLSNTSIQFDEYKDNIMILKEFDGYYISAQTKLAKPTKEVFLDFINKFKLEAKECIFIDDIKQNIDGAKAIGMQGYVFDEDIDKFRNYLKIQGLL